MRRTLGIVLGLAILGVACGPAAQPTPTPTKAAAVTPTAAPTAAPTAKTATSSGDPTKGAALFGSVSPPCAGCHGVKAEGGIGPKIAGTTLDLDTMQKQVRDPRSRKSGGIMPPYSKDAVSDEQIADIYAWLKSLQ